MEPYKKVLEAFQSEQIRQSEELFAQMFAENDGLRLFFINENSAYTDGINIVVDPATDELYYDTDALKKTAELLRWDAKRFYDYWNALHVITRAQTLHECLHIIYSAFPGYVFRDNIYKTKNERKVAHLIDNIIEDAYIEAVGAEVYDNIGGYLKFGRVSRIFARYKSKGTVEEVLNFKNQVDEEQIKKQFLIKYYLDYMCGYLLYPMLFQLSPIDELKEYVDKTKSLFDKGALAPSPKERYSYIVEIFEIVKPLIPDDDYEIDSPRLNRLLYDQKTHFGGTSLVEYESEGKTQKVSKGLFESNSDGENDIDLNGVKKVNLDGFDHIVVGCDNFKNIKDAILVEISLDDFKKLLDATKVSSSAIHKGIKIEENHHKPNMLMKKAYNNIYNKYRININSYNSKFAQILKGRVTSRENKYKFGVGIESKMLGDTQKRYWYRNVTGIEVPDIAIMLLIDGSGSMRGNRIKAAKNASVVLHEVLAKQGIPHAIVEHRANSSTPEVDINVLWDFNSKSDCKYNILSLEAENNTRDGLTLCWAEKYINCNCDNDEKVIIVVSDGAPEHAYDNYYPPVSVKDAQNVAKKITLHGIKLIAIAIDEGGSYCYDLLNEIYPNIIKCSDIGKLTGQILGVVSKLL